MSWGTEVAGGGTGQRDAIDDGNGPSVPPRAELDVMQLLADGYSDPQIARLLTVSLVTVRRRAQRFCKRLGAKSRLQAMAEAVARGWIEARLEDET